MKPSLLCGVCALMWVGAAASSPARAQPGSAPGPTAVSPQVDAILDHIEHSDRNFTSIQADLEYSVVQLLKANEDDPDEVQNFQGSVRFLKDSAQTRFFIHFREWNDGRLRFREQQWFAFDGEWLTHAQDKSKSVVREQVARPGERSDLFKLGNGPFPLPFGQPKHEILEQLEVSLVPQSAGDPPNTDHLMCIPRPGSRVGERFEKIELFVLRESSKDLSGLPMKIIAHNWKDSTLQTAVLSKIKKNPRLHPQKDFAIPQDTRGWDVQEKPLP